MAGSRARIAGIALSLVLMAIVFGFVLPRVADYGQVWSIVGRLSPAALALLVAAAVVNILTFPPPWMAALPGLGYRRAMVLTQSSTALSNAAPGGDAIGAAVSWGMLRAWGFNRSAVALAVGVFSLWNQFVNIGVPVVALVLLTFDGEHNALLSTAALIGVIALAGLLLLMTLVLRSEGHAHAVGERAGGLVDRAARLFSRRGPRGWGPALADFRDDPLALLRRRWALLTGATLLGHATVFVVLMVALRALGVHSDQVSLAEALAAWSLVRLLTAVPLTPGGIGVVELGLTGALVGFGGPQVRVVAAVLVYRFLTFVPPIPIGAVCALTWRRHHPGAEPEMEAS